MDCQGLKTGIEAGQMTARSDSQIFGRSERKFGVVCGQEVCLSAWHVIDRARGTHKHTHRFG